VAGDTSSLTGDVEALRKRYQTIARDALGEKAGQGAKAGKAGKPGKVLGNTAVKKGESNNVVIKLSEDVPVGGKLWPMLHIDAGAIGTYEFPGPDAPVIVEDPDFPAMKGFPSTFTIHDEVYQHKDFSRDKVRVLARLDASKLDFSKPQIHRTDKDFPVAWAKMYGKGRVFYSTFGHTDESWDDPRVQKMYTEAIKWALRLTGTDVTPRK